MMTNKSEIFIPSESSNQLVLIVDDLQTNRQILSSIISKNNYRIIEASNGSEALNMIREQNPDIILLNIMMPGIDGFEVCRHLKADPDTSNIPVIFITAKMETQYITQGFNAGAVDYITKPFNGAELLARIRTHLTLRETQKQLEHINASKDRFFSIIAHDLKSPFSSIVSFLRLVTKNIDTLSKDDLIELTEELKSITVRTQDLLENLLEWSRSQTGRIEFSPARQNLRYLIQNAVNPLTDAANQKNIHFHFHIPEEIFVNADKNMAFTVIRNLTSNSIKFSMPKSAVYFSAAVTDKYAEICIKDEGIGMSEEKAAGLFDISKMHSTAGTAGEKGTGLGLILCKDFVDKHGGKLWVKSIKGIGSSFFFTLPIITD